MHLDFFSSKQSYLAKNVLECEKSERQKMLFTPSHRTREFLCCSRVKESHEKKRTKLEQHSASIIIIFKIRFYAILI